MNSRRLSKTILLLLLVVIFSWPLNVQAANKTYVATIDGKPYTSISAAVKSVKNGQTITVFKDIVTSKTVEIKRPNIVFTLNLAGNRYKYTGNETAFKIIAGNVVVRNAKLHSNNFIFRVQHAAKLQISGGYYSGYIVNSGNMVITLGTFNTKSAKKKNINTELISNRGRLEIRNGTFEGTYDNAVYNYGGKLTIKDGTFKCDAKNGKDSYFPVILAVKKASTTIENGKFYGAGVCFHNEDNSKAYITGGTFQSNKVGTVVNYCASINIYGGTIIQKKGNVYCGLTNYNGSLYVNGGKITGTLYNECPDKGKTVIKKGNINYSYDVAIYNKSGVLEIQNGQYRTKKNNTVLNEKKGKLYISGGSFVSGDNYYTLVNNGYASLTGGAFRTEENSDSIFSTSGSTIRKTSNVTYSGRIVYE